MPKYLLSLVLLSLCCTLAGCAATNGSTNLSAPPASAVDPKEPPPTGDELPVLIVLEKRTLPYTVGVEAYGPKRIARGVVPEFRPIEPTPEERAILGEEPDDEELLEDLVFYRKPPSAEDGIYPFDNEVTYGSTFMNNSVAGRTLDTNRVSGVGFTEWGNENPPISSFNKSIGSVMPVKQDKQLVSGENKPEYGIGLPAEKAGQASRIDH